MEGGTISIVNPKLEIDDNSSIIFRKGRSLIDDIDFYKHNTMQFDIDFGPKTTSYNEAMILLYILEATGIHHNNNIPHFEYNYIIIPSNIKYLDKELSFNSFEFFDGFKDNHEKYNCNLISKNIYRKINFEEEYDISKDIIFINDLWNLPSLDLNTKKKITQCMALSIHYRIEQQFYFWDLLNINEEEKKEIIYHRNNTVIKTDLINKFCPITYINLIIFFFIKFIIFNSVPVI